MLRVPDTDEVKALGQDLGFNFTHEEASILQPKFANALRRFHRLSEMRIGEEQGPAETGSGRRSWRLTAEQDPLNTFTWACRVEGAPEGVLSGKTVGLKDNIALAGVPLTMGSHFMDGYIPDYDATVATRLLAHGATIVGKLNMHDFASGGGLVGIGDFGRTPNPYDHERVSGGSSSGCAVAVATGTLDLAIGDDQGGSIRNPAHYCGVVGVKPTYGLVPHTGAVGADPSLDHLGPLTRTVRDAAQALQCIAGSDNDDPRQAACPQEIDLMTGLGDGVRGLRIGLLLEGIGYEGMESEVSDAALNCLDALAGAGAVVGKVSIPMHEEAYIPASAIMLGGTKRLYDTNLGGAFYGSSYPTSLMTMFGRFKRSSGHELPISYKQMIALAEYVERNYHGRFYAKAQNMRAAVRKAYDDAFQNFDVLVCPTKPTRAPKFTEPRDHREELEFFLDRVVSEAAFSRNTAPFNYTGHPAISVPCAMTGGLPIGVQLVGRHFEDALLLRVASTIQEIVGLSRFELPNGGGRNAATGDGNGRS
ncbi:MAG TPA: amidase family protein [Devosiaceae bacterium]|nr:amidase family protein [Devosiaceae bacterium]